MIVGGYEDGFIRICDTHSKRITKEFKAHDLRVRIIAWNKRDRCIA